MTSKSPRKTSFLTNTIFSLLSWFSPIIIGFVATPLILKSLGTRDYGLYATILGFISYSFTFGVGKVIVKYIAEFRSTGESEKISGVVSATFWLSLTIAIVTTSIVALTAKWIVAEVMFLPADQLQTAETALYLACAAIIVTMVSVIFQSILQGLNRFGSYLLLTNVSGLLLNAGNIYLAVSGYGVTHLLAWNLIALSLMGAVFATVALPNLPELSLGLDGARAMAPLVFRYASNIILAQIFGNIIFVFERVWILRKFGSEASTFYLVPMTLGIYLLGVVISISQIIFPAVNELLNDRERLIDLYKKATKLIYGFIVFALVTLVCSGRQLLWLWISPEMSSAGYSILVIHSLTFVSIAGMMNTLILADGFRFSSLNTLLTLGWMLSAIPLMVLLADQWQTEGVAVARTIGVVATLPLIFYAENRFLGRVLWRFWVAIGWRLGLAAAFTVVVEIGFTEILTLGWISLIACVAAGSATYGLILVITGFLTREEKEFFRGYVTRQN